MLGASLVLLANLLRRGAAPAADGLRGGLERPSSRRSWARVLCTVVFAAAFLGGSELVDQRLVVVALLIIAGSTLVGATR